MTPIETCTLELTDIADLHRTFCRAFSDYQVPMDLPLWKFKGMLQRRGFTPAASLGAFADGELVGLLLNGLRPFDGRFTAYDLGTGVAPEWRKQGITSRMFAQVLELLRARGVEQYLLEVLTVNEGAYRLYLKQGFTVTRRFACYRAEKEALGAGGDGSVRPGEPFTAVEWETLRTFWTHAPSWQNSVDSLDAVAAELAFLRAETGGELVGYAVCDPRSGDLAQLAVRPDLRRRGIGRALVAAAARVVQANRLTVLNVDAEDGESLAFWRALGFENFVDQYEMALGI